MSQYNSTLFDMTAQVAAYKPNSKKTQIEKDINGRIRALIDYRPFWSALLTRSVINIPGAYQTGSVSIATGSTAVTGNGTAWPVGDVVNSTVPSGVRQTGFQEVQPASMAGITVDTNLYVSDGVFSEVISVVDTTSQTFTAQYQFQHNPSFSIQASSLNGLQLILGSMLPVYTLLAVTSTTGGIIDMAFGGGALVNSAYSLIKAYLTIDPNFKDFYQVWDPIQGVGIPFHQSQAFLAASDPQRTASGNPQCLVDLSPNASGSMQFELWPYQYTPYSLPMIYIRQWPTLKRPTDRPPYFINPSVIIYGAIADALRRRDIRSDGDRDPYFDPALAREYEEKFAHGAMYAASADESKCLQALQQNFGNFGVNAAYQQSHIGPWDDGGW